VTPFGIESPADFLLPGPHSLTKHYTQLKQIADDVDDAPVYGGIRFRFDQVDGNVPGRAVATEIYKNNLRPVHGRP
jgi:hypothetical protein